MRVPLSVLDVFPVATGVRPSRAITDSVELARAVDRLGYTRYWVAEHHNLPGVASAAPEVLIAHVAQVTSRIRVGAGGIMVPNHTPLRVVEIFRTLEALYPGRIDLGLGRAPGTDQVTASALRRSGAEVNQELAELLAFADGSFPPDHPYGKIIAQPSDVALPPIWMLGSTSAGAAIAAALGVGFAFAGHFSMAEADRAIASYRRGFRADLRTPSSKLILALAVICAESDERAEALARPLRLAYSRMAQGRPGTFPSVEEARSYTFTAVDDAAIARFTDGLVVGSEAKVEVELRRIVETRGADELMVTTMTPDLEARIDSYARLARIFALEGSAAHERA